MPVVSRCPESDALQRFALNQSDPGEALQVQRHLVHCVLCTEMVRSLKDAVHVLGTTPAPVTSVHVTTAVAAPAVVPPAPAAAVSEPRDLPAPVRSAKEFAYLAPPEAPGELGRLGSYRVLKRLGQGGMGVVFECEDLQLQRKVALKVMLPEPAQDPTGRERFLQEARAAAAIEHDHIVTIYQVGEDRGIPFLAMQILQGETLSDALRREERLSLRELLRIGREIAEGLAAAHSRGLIHRDIKPANIWLEAGKRRVKILDFGLARLTGEKARNLTQSGMVVGTVGYMSPEQARGIPADGRSDLFSLACVIYEMATGREPFPGTDTMARLTALAVDDPVPPQKHNPQLPGSLNELILWMLAKDPQDRPRSAQAVADALRAIDLQRSANSTIRRQTAAKAKVQAPSPSESEPDEKKKPFTVWHWAAIVGLLAVLAAVGFHLGWLLLNRSH